MGAKDIKERVTERYGAAARAAASGAQGSCCGTGCCASTTAELDPISADLYEEAETKGLPMEAVLASLGCGNPTALAQLGAGETVLDLGSGGGIDVFLSAQRVGPSGKVYGVDLTDEMLELARKNQAAAGVDNVEFLKGDIENIPLPDDAVDVIISNCVINLAADKGTVLAEAFRVLKPGGRFAVSDIVVRGSLPERVRRSVELWADCIAGALEEGEFLALLRGAGFEDASIEPMKVYALEDAHTFLADAGLNSVELARELDGRIMSAFVRARKPV